MKPCRKVKELLELSTILLAKPIGWSMGGIRGWSLFLIACVLFLPFDGTASATVPVAAPPVSNGDRLAGPAEENAVNQSEPRGLLQTAAATNGKARGRAKVRKSRQQHDDPWDADINGQYAPPETESLMQALKPIKDVKWGRVNMPGTRAGLAWAPRAGGRDDLSVLWFRRGLIHGVKNEYDSAIAAFTVAIRIDPRDFSSYYNRAVMRQKGGEYEAAIADYTKAARLAPSDADTYYNRGLAQQWLGKPRAAIADYARAIRMNPNDAAAYWNRGVAFSRQGREDLASADYCAAFDAASREKESRKNGTNDLEIQKLLAMDELSGARERPKPKDKPKAEKDSKPADVPKAGGEPKPKDISKTPDVPKVTGDVKATDSAKSKNAAPTTSTPAPANKAQAQGSGTAPNNKTQTQGSGTAPAAAPPNTTPAPAAAPPPSTANPPRS